MKSHIKMIFIVCVIAGLPISETFALYPVQSHHAQTHGKDNKNISFNYSYEYEEAEHTNDTTKTQEYDTILGYGLTDDLDIVIQIPYKHIEYENKKNYNGLDDISLEAKWKFFDSEEFTLSIYPEITFPTGDYKKDVGNGSATYATTFIATKKRDIFLFHLTGQYTRNENKNDDRLDLWETHFSAVVAVFPGLSIIGDAGLRKDSNKSNDKLPISVSGGLSYEISKNFSIHPTFKSEWNNLDKTDLTFVIGSSLKF